MALMLYRLGRWCARHPWRVIGGWLVVLALLGGAAGTMGRPPTSKVTLADADFQKVADQLARTIPMAAGGVGTVVLHSPDGFTSQQRTAIADVFAQWQQIPHVKGVQDPFANQKRTDEGVAQLARARTELAAGSKRLAKGKAQLDAAKGQLDFGATVLADARRAHPRAKATAALARQLADGRKKYRAGLAAYTKGKAELDKGELAVTQGEAQTAMMHGLRFVTADNRYAVVQVQFDDNTQSLPPEVRDRIPAVGAAGLSRVGVTADYSREITERLDVIGAGEIIGLSIALLVLVVMLGSLIAAGLPLAVALLGVGVGVAGAMAATAFYEMNATTPSLALMLGLAVGIDYALFIVNRHRSQLLRGTELEESIGRANGTAGSAVLFAGATVVIALAALVVSGVPILAQMGLVAAATVAVTVLVALTVSPALLGILRRRVIPRRTWQAHEAAHEPTGASDQADDEPEEEHGGWYVGLITRHPWLTILAVVGIVAVLALPVRDLRLGLPDGSQEPAGSTAYRTYHLVDEHFVPGMNGPVVAVATLPPGTTAESARATQIAIGQSFARTDGVTSVVPFGTSTDHRTLAFQVLPDDGPASARTAEVVRVLRDSTPAIGEVTGTRIGLTGQTVANIELSETLAAALAPYLAVVVGLSLLILMIVFRSLRVPLVATLGFLLSVGAAFGVTVAVFQWGWFRDVLGISPGALLSFMPIMLIGVLFGLAMDYQMFLVSGMHEAHAHGQEARAAVRSGFVHGAKVVTAAAIIMFSVFGGFVFSHIAMVRPIGMGLAVGVLVDAVLVRMTLTPAVMHLLGESAWRMPAWLDRLLPHLDIEGESLLAHLEEERARAASTDSGSLVVG